MLLQSLLLVVTKPYLINQGRLPQGEAVGASRQARLSGPISGFVQRGELMLERMRAHLEAGNLKGVRREALRMKATAAQLENRRLIRLSDRLAAQAEQSDPKQVAATLSQVRCGCVGAGWGGPLDLA